MRPPGRDSASALRAASPPCSRTGSAGRRPLFVNVIRMLSFRLFRGDIQLISPGVADRVGKTLVDRRRRHMLLRIPVGKLPCHDHADPQLFRRHKHQLILIPHLLRLPGEEELYIAAQPCLYVRPVRGRPAVLDIAPHGQKIRPHLIVQAHAGIQELFFGRHRDDLPVVGRKAPVQFVQLTL